MMMSFLVLVVWHSAIRAGKTRRQLRLPSSKNVASDSDSLREILQVGVEACSEACFGCFLLLCGEMKSEKTSKKSPTVAILGYLGTLRRDSPLLVHFPCGELGPIFGD